MEEFIRNKIIEFFREEKKISIAADQVVVGPPRNSIFGDVTFAAFKSAKVVQMNPVDLATEAGNYLMHKISIAKAISEQGGYLNITLNDQYWIGEFQNINKVADFGVSKSNGKKVMVEYCAPNTNKPLHLGHLRNIFLGYSVGEILKAAGNEVVKVNMINDRGVHICKSMLAYQKFGQGETPQSAHMKGDHLVGKYYVKFDTELKKQVTALVEDGIEKEKAEKEAPLMQEVREMLLKWEQGDQEVRALWSLMNSWVYEGFTETFKKIGNDFQKNYYESETYLKGKEIVEQGLKEKIFYKKDDGSVWISLANQKIDDKLVLRTDGTSVYITQDLGTAQMKYEDFHCDDSIYVVADEQNYHFKVLKIICQKLKMPFADGIFHLNYGMVDLPSGKMKSREGTVVDADDLITEMENESEQLTRSLGKIENFSEEELRILFHQLGMGALKFYILKVDPRKRMIFDPKESIDFHGHTGPFIQYTHARICSVLRKANESGISMDPLAIKNLEPEEKEIIKTLLRFPSDIKEAARQYEPSLVGAYAYELAKKYNAFYAALPILKADVNEVKAFRINLCKVTAQVLKKSMKLLGIEVPERM